MTARPRSLLSLLLALLLLFSQQAGLRHVLAHASTGAPAASAVTGMRSVAAPTDSRERGKACVECLALHGLDSLPGTSAGTLAEADAIAPLHPRSPGLAHGQAPSPKAQAPPLPA